MDPLARLFGSPTRLKLLRLFIFNQDLSFSLDDIVERAKVGKDAARKELGDFTVMGLVKQKGKGREGRYGIDRRFGQFEALDTFIRETTALRPEVILEALKKAGTPRLVILSGLFTGMVEPQIDLLVVGDTLDERAITRAVAFLESELGREIRYASFATADFRYRLGVYDRLVRDVFDYSHKVILDKIGL